MGDHRTCVGFDSVIGFRFYSRELGMACMHWSHRSFLAAWLFSLFIPRLPAGLSASAPGFVRSFDWPGVGLLAAWMTSFLFYLSSRPITGIAPFQDWRLLAVTLLFAVLLVWWEAHRNAVIDNPSPPDPIPFQGNCTQRGIS